MCIRDRDIVNYATENVVKFITGEKSLSEWDAYVAELNNGLTCLAAVADTHLDVYKRQGQPGPGSAYDG